LRLPDRWRIIENSRAKHAFFVRNPFISAAQIQPFNWQVVTDIALCKRPHHNWKDRKM
jgi:hypothetical protein